MHCRLPEGVIVNKDTKLACWDCSKKIWRTGGLEDIKIDIGQYIIRGSFTYHYRLLMCICTCINVIESQSELGRGAGLFKLSAHVCMKNPMYVYNNSGNWGEEL